jgi:hypothetical protein
MKCIKPVENFVRDYNFFTDDLMFAAVCHGEKEICRFKHERLEAIIEAAKKGKLVESKAFDDSIKKLNNEPPKE